MNSSQTLMLIAFSFLVPATLPAQTTEKPIVIEVIDLNLPVNKGRFDESRPPIVVEGRQVESLGKLRIWLRRKADPTRWPDETKPLISGTKIRPSGKKVHIDCDATQLFGWVQALLQYCTILPGEAMPVALAQSPLVHKIELGMRGTKRRIPTYLLPTSLGLAEVEAPIVDAEVILQVPRSEWEKPPHGCRIVFKRVGSTVPLGASRGIAFMSPRPGHLSLLLDPPETLLTVRRYLRLVRKVSPKAKVKINAYARTPFVYAFEIVEAAIEEGYKDVTYSGIPTSLIRDLASGALRAKPGPGGLLAMTDAAGGILAGEKAASAGDAIGLGGAGGALGGRRGGRRNLRTRGGGGRSQLGVQDGLKWLAGHQSPDGHWDSDAFMNQGDPARGPICDGKGDPTHDVGVTGLALLAFLGAGNTHREGVHRPTVRRGLKWLKSVQDAEGCFGSRQSHSFTYGHAIATLTMAEAYGMTRSGIWKGSAQNGINFALKCQNPYVAWRYGERPGDNDVSVTTWMVMALKSGKAAGLEVEDKAFQWAHEFIKKMTDDETGRTGYTRRGERPVRAEGRLEKFPAPESESLTAAGILVRIFCGENPKESPVIKAGSELLLKRLPVWEPAAGKVDLYYWHLGTLAMFQVGGSAWRAWNTRMKTVLLETQRTDGNFLGSWDPVGPWGADGGRVYSTALMTLCLEVYYRYGRIFGGR